MPIYRNKLNKEYNLILITFITHSIFSATNIERMFRYHNNITICVGLYRALSCGQLMVSSWRFTTDRRLCDVKIR